MLHDIFLPILAYGILQFPVLNPVGPPSNYYTDLSETIPYQVPRDELLVLADGQRHLARRMDRHVYDSGLKE